MGFIQKARQNKFTVDLLHSVDHVLRDAQKLGNKDPVRTFVQGCVVAGSVSIAELFFPNGQAKKVNKLRKKDTSLNEQKMLKLMKLFSIHCLIFFLQRQSKLLESTGYNEETFKKKVFDIFKFDRIDLSNYRTLQEVLILGGSFYFPKLYAMVIDNSYGSDKFLHSMKTMTYFAAYLGETYEAFLKIAKG